MSSMAWLLYGSYGMQGQDLIESCSREALLRTAKGTGRRWRGVLFRKERRMC